MPIPPMIATQAQMGELKATVERLEAERKDILREARAEARAEADAHWIELMRESQEKVAKEKNFEVRTATLEDGTVVQVLVPKKP